MFAGTSYYHQPQRKGRAFEPGRLKGYFNDLTGKADWRGKVDQNGLPINTLTTGETVYFPVVLCQKALGHWDRWLIKSNQEDREAFLKLARWVLATQDSCGGWDTWTRLGLPAGYRYSSMTQGEAISVMARAHSITSEAPFESACRKAIELMRRPVAEEGVCWEESGEVYLEEYPGPRRDTVLNGWMFSLFGVYDYLLEFPDKPVQAFYDKTCASLIRSLPDFDAGYWSYYSSGTKRLASPFYHELHLGQLEALAELTAHPTVTAIFKQWTRYGRNKPYKVRAIITKAIEKLREPREISVTG